MNNEDSPDRVFPTDLRSLPPDLPLIIPMTQQGNQPTVLQYQPRRKSFKDWGTATKVAFICLLIIGIASTAAAGILLWRYFNPHPKLDAGPPAGWRVASDEEIKQQQESLDRLTSETTLDYLYVSDVEGGSAIVVHMKEFHIFSEPLPDTDDISEMEAWLLANRAAIKEALRLTSTEDDISAVKLTQDGVAVQVDHVTVTESASTYTTFFYINEHGTAFVVRISTVNESLNTSMVEFIVDNLRFE